MLYLDNEMSELFRKASEDIRLKPEDDDWDKIQKKLLSDVSSLPCVIMPFKKRKNYRIWACTLIIFAFSLAAVDLMINGEAERFKIKDIHESNRVIQSEKRSAIKNEPVVLREKSTRLLQFSEPLKGKKLNVLLEADQINIKTAAFTCVEQLVKTGVPLKLDLLRNGESNKNQTSIINGKRFYVGIIAGPQFSQTKQQKFSKAGLSAGILLGFHLNSRLSVESEFIISNKQFGSDGQYFDRRKISGSMPSGMKLIHVQSKINELEIPVNIKYDLLKIKKNDLFVSGGISSYILTQENNQYQAFLNGNHETMAGNYPEHQNYFAAAINIGAGYEYRASKNINLRIEPYFQIPLKTIGMGSMRVLSSGVYLGITIPVIK